jgi:GT2 family glycosyltransferase
VDNASNDGSPESVKEKYSEIQLIRLSKNLGFAAANNVAVALFPECEWVALVNPDAFPEPKWLENLLRAARAYPDYSFYASRMFMKEDPSKLDGAGDVYHTSGAAWRRGHGRKCQTSDLQKIEMFGACAGAALYRREAFVGVGGFDEAYFCYFEDVDLAFRMRLAGHRCLYVPDAVVYHVGSATTGGKRSEFTTYHGQRNLVWTYVKNMPLFLFWLYLPQHILLNLAMLSWYSLRWDALRGLPRVLKQRRRIQKTKRVSARELRCVMGKGLLRPYLRRHV